MNNTPADNPKDSRHLARIMAVQYVFSQIITQSEDSQTAQNYSNFEPASVLDILEEKKANLKLYEKLVDGVEHNVKLIDDTITKTAPAWPISQINPVDLAILRVGLWEAFIGRITPEKVVINECIELAKEMSSHESAKFVNGVLGKILNTEKLQNDLQKSNKN